MNLSYIGQVWWVLPSIDDWIVLPEVDDGGSADGAGARYRDTEDITDAALSTNSLLAPLSAASASASTSAQYEYIPD